MKRPCLIIAILCCLHLQVIAQTGNLVFKHINRASGLPVDEITCLAQDSTGFIWIGSKEGLFRFDGFNFKNFSHIPGNNQTIPNNHILKLHVDKEGLLWIGTAGGMALIKNNGQVLKVLKSETNTLFSKFADDVFDIREDQSTFWISTGDGLFSARKKENEISGLQKHDLKKDFGHSTNQLGSMQIQRGQLWISTLHGLVIYNPEKRTLLHSRNNPDSLNILKERHAFKSLSIDEKGNSILYSTWEPAVRIYDRAKNKTTTIYTGRGSANPDFSNLINQFLKDGYGTLWMATGKGIKTIDNSNSEQINTHKPGNLYSIQSNYVTSLLQDKEGSIWAGTNEGISITQPYKQSFVNLSANNVEEYPFAEWPVTDIIPVDSNTFLIGGGKGVFRTDASFKVEEHYLFGTIKYDWIWKHFIQGNDIYISAQEGSLVYDIKTKKLKKITEPPFDRFYPISSFISGKNGAIWMSQYYNNFLKYNPYTKQYKTYNLPALGEEPSIIQLAKDNDNNLWILSSAGIFKFDEVQEKIIERFLVNEKNGLQAPPFFKRPGR